MTNKERFIDTALLLGTAFAILTALFADFTRECDGLYESTFRLHITANSDSERDQMIKYALRDYILTDLGDIFTGCAGAEEAKAAALRETEYITAKANEFLAAHDCEYSAVVSAGAADFPTRVYADITLPGGTYEALRVVLGDGKGKNWWCVLYPSVCISAAGAETSPSPVRPLYEKNKRANRLTADSLRAEKGGIEYRFALYDFLRSLFGMQ